MKTQYCLMAFVFVFAWRGECARYVLSIESVAGLPKVGYPGPKPFRGADELIVTADPPLMGDVTLTLTEGRRVGKPLSFVTRGGSEMRFRTALDPMGWYRFSAIDGMGPSRRWTMKGVFRQTAAAAARLGVETGNPLHVTCGSDEPVVLTLHNPSDCPLAWKGVLEVRDFWEQGFELPFDRTVGAGETVRLPLSRELKKGYWHVLACLTGDDGRVSTNETSFAVLDRHVVTPYVPYGTFRMGINYHLSSYDEQDKALTLEALTACGAKLVRCDITVRFSYVCARGPDSWDWQESDRLLKLLESRGLALDVMVYSTPVWARCSERDVPVRYAATIPPRRGLLGRFCREAAARYGTRIDYYEIGNEWDLRKTEVITIDEAIELQKEAYADVKAGCPQARVIPNGWALASSDHPMISQKGFQERVMEEAEGCYDAHPVHIHGRFPYFAERLRNGFFAFREKIGIASVPWYANETALSSAHGAEKAAAEAVFKKILWAQACGRGMKGQSLLIQVRQAKLGRTNSGRSYIVKKSTCD